MKLASWLVSAGLIWLTMTNALAESHPWGKAYFPDVFLTTEQGKKVNFFDDLIKDKVVAINFIYTTCPDTCPLETAQLMRVQNLMGDRIGKDVHIYSITTDPEIDTPEVLQAYKKKFGAKWQFLTGKEEDIIEIRRKLGLYLEEIADSKNHNVSMIIGNQATGQWMKRSPFENPHVLADQLGNWLSNWKATPLKQADDYANAPELRSVSKGEQLYRTRCSTCHTVTGNELPGALGPDLKDVAQHREATWLLNWLRAPDQMIKNKDPIALELLAKYNNLTMPNMRLNQLEAQDILDFIAQESDRVDTDLTAAQRRKLRRSQITQPKVKKDQVAVMNAWIREAHPQDTVNAGYFTLVNIGKEDLKLTGVSSTGYASVEVHEMAVSKGMMKMREVTEVIIPAMGSLDLAPGGKHLMLKKPFKALKKGDRVDLVLAFANGSSQHVTLGVEAR